MSFGTLVWYVVEDGWELVQESSTEARQLHGAVKLKGSVVEVVSWSMARHDHVTCYPLDSFGGGLTVAECQYQVVAELLYDAAERANDTGERQVEARAKLALLEDLLARMGASGLVEKDATASCQPAM